MTASGAIEYFRVTYPGKHIVALPEEDPTEIICEIDPADEHPEYGTAIAAIKASVPHYHKKATETYKVLRGDLKLFVDDQQHVLEVGDTFVIKPEQIHYAEGDFTLVEVVSRPGWTPEDHI